VGSQQGVGPHALYSLILGREGEGLTLFSSSSNDSFAYVDFSSAEACHRAVKLSEGHLGTLDCPILPYPCHPFS
jgi:hypothetical protein